MSVPKVTRTTSVECPDCGERIVLKLPVERGQLVTCDNCEAELEVIETNPVELDWVSEDWDDDDDDDDDW
jgi:alpha-aminoadipate carrier protein LysW